MLPLLLVCWLACLGGCAHETPVPRFAGVVISHIDAYGSETGGRHKLSSDGEMSTGFDYTDTSQTDWSADIRWSFLREEGDADVYRIKCEFTPKGGASSRTVDELIFDGSRPAKLPVNEQLIISIEPQNSAEEA